MNGTHFRPVHSLQLGVVSVVSAEQTYETNVCPGHSNDFIEFYRNSTAHLDLCIKSHKCPCLSPNSFLCMITLSHSLLGLIAKVCN